MQLLLALGLLGLTAWWFTRKPTTPTPTMRAGVRATAPIPPGPTITMTPGGTEGDILGSTTAYFALPTGATWPDPVANPGVVPVTFGPGTTLTGVFQGFNTATQQPTYAQPQGTDAMMWAGLSGTGTIYFQFIMPDGSISAFTWTVLPPVA